VFTKPSPLALNALRAGRICRFLLIPDGRIR
ncbi:protein YhiY, partial [Escherichia coli]